MTNTIHTANGEQIEVFARYNRERQYYEICHGEDGSRVTVLDGSWPLDSTRSGSYEHPEGINMTIGQVRDMGIEVE